MVALVAPCGRPGGLTWGFPYCPPWSHGWSLSWFWLVQYDWDVRRCTWDVREKDLGLGVAVAGGCGVVGDWMLGWGQRPWFGEGSWVGVMRGKGCGTLALATCPWALPPRPRTWSSMMLLEISKQERIHGTADAGRHGPTVVRPLERVWF